MKRIGILLLIFCTWFYCGRVVADETMDKYHQI